MEPPDSCPPGFVARCRAAVRIPERRTGCAPWPGDLTDRLDHFVREDARVLPALQAFESADAVALGQLSAESQADAEHLLGNQVPETSALVRTARTHGAFAAASFGAGFGGAVWALVEAGRASDFARQWHAGAFVMRPGLPLTELPTK